MAENIETNMTTEELLAQRHQVYGDRVENMERVAQMWSGYLGFAIRPVDVPAMLALYKMYRLNVEPEYSDNIDDVDGYMQMTREVIGDRLIKARTVDEFIARRNLRDQKVRDSHPSRAQVEELNARAERVSRDDGESLKDRLERQHEERAYGQSMGRGE